MTRDDSNFNIALHGLSRHLVTVVRDDLEFRLDACSVACVHDDADYEALSAEDWVRASGGVPPDCSEHLPEHMQPVSYIVALMAIWHKALVMDSAADAMTLVWDGRDASQVEDETLPELISELAEALGVCDMVVMYERGLPLEDIVA